MGKGIVSWPCEGFFAVCFTGKPERARRLQAELRRVEIADPSLVWTFPSPYRDLILRSIPHIKELDEHPGGWGATLGNYRAVKTAYELGMESAMIMEDDCRFLKDLSAVEAAMACVPPNWDMLMLDHFGDKGTEGDAPWRLCRSTWSTACYIVNRKAMERLILMYESPVSGKYKKPMMRNCDHWTNTAYVGADVRIYCAYPNVAIQCDCGDSTNYNQSPGLALQRMFYERLHLDMNAYWPF